MREVSVRTFLAHVERPLGLSLVAGAAGLERRLRSTRIQKPGLALAGYTDFVHDDRVQILGQTELSYLGSLGREAQEWSIDGYVARRVACIVITKGLEPPALLAHACEVDGTPLLRTPITSSECIRKVLAYLDDLLSPRCSLHGVLVDVDGVGVLITGASGIGKSECALDLVARGHRLVADDVVEIRRRGEDLVGQASHLIQDLIEVRGLGILNVAELYGVAATRDHKRIELHVELEAWSAEAVYDRTGLEARSRDILGVPVRSLVVPVQPGRNVAGIVEVAARNLLLQLRGHHAPRDLDRRIRAAASLEPAGAVERGSAAGLRVAASMTEVTDHIEDEVE
jgi:HPr kinase/phosphorylase